MFRKYVPIVPQLERIVKRCRQDVLAVWGELDERDGRVVVVDQGLQALARRGVPYLSLIHI